MDQPFYYHSRDPIENLRVKITIRRIADGENRTKESGRNFLRRSKKTNQDVNNNGSKKNNKHLIWSKVFKWQEKVMGPQEIMKYQPGGDGHFEKKTSEKRVEIEYREELAKLFKEKKPLLEKEEELILFSYTDKDGYVPPIRNLKNISTSNNLPNKLAETVMTLPTRGESYKSNKKNKFSNHLAREGAFKIMYIMASVDILPEDYEAKKHQFDDHVLCTIKYYPEGMLEVVPGFSETIDEFSDPLALKRGPKISTFRFYSTNGSQYEYNVENESNLMEDEEELIRELRALEIHEDIKQVQKWKNQSGQLIFDNPPPDYDVRILSDIEIVSAANFQGDAWYIQYETYLPTEGWHWCPEVNLSDLGSMKCGITQTAKIICKKSRYQTGEPSLAPPIAYFGFPIELNMLTKPQQNPLLSAKQPQLILQVFARDGWDRVFTEGYTSVALPSIPGFYDFVVNTWKPRGTLRDRRRNFFLGGANQLLDPLYVYNNNDPNDTFISKFGFEAEGSGEIRLRINVREQRHYEEEAAQNQGKTFKRSINDILSSLKGFGIRRNSSSILQRQDTKEENNHNHISKDE